ncbi:MAG: hypothetical protein SFY96_07525 [Planctomycetota bacterium]|nr:hypothetical protein [Planctomycetota bacterium]
MILASLGIFIVWAACMVSGLLWPQSELTRQAAIALVTLPVGVAWLMMECVHAVTPRRLFDRRRHAAFARLLHGTFVGTLGVLLSLLFLPLVDEWSPDAITLGFASAAAALICTLPRGRIAAGHLPALRLRHRDPRPRHALPRVRQCHHSCTGACFRSRTGTPSGYPLSHACGLVLHR